MPVRHLMTGREGKVENVLRGSGDLRLVIRWTDGQVGEECREVLQFL
jgi:hypothetical protein